MKIILTSFKWFHESLSTPCTGYSAAMYQPSWYPKLETLRGFLIQDTDGSWIRPRLFANSKYPLRSYGDELYWLYSTRRSEIEAELQALQSKHRTIALCCWCPNDKAAKRQLSEHGSYVCHLGVVDWFLREEFGILCRSTNDHLKMVQFPWRVR